MLQLKNLVKTINGQVSTTCFIKFHYKQPLDWNENLINESQNTLDKWYGQFEKIKHSELNEDLLKPLRRFKYTRLYSKITFTF